MALSLSLALLGFPTSLRAEAPPTAPAEEGAPAPAGTASAEEPASATSLDEASASAPTATETTEEAAPTESAEAIPETKEQGSEEVVAQPEAPPSPAPAAEPAREESTPSVAGRTRKSARDYSIPYYQQKRPQWALELAAAARSGFGSEGRLAGASSSGVRSFQILGEYQPLWFQSAGVLGLGVSAGLYSTDPANQVTSNLAGLLSYGIQARYEARFIRNQWVVPTIGYAAEWVKYSLRSGASGTVDAGGIFYGAMLLLSAFDEASAAEMYANLGVSRVYLLAESRSREGTDANLTLSGRSYFFGLRFEF
jgi:hypothetical protein